MKKLLAIVLTLALLCTLSVSAFAATFAPTGDTSKELQVQYSKGSRQNVYAATIVWEDMIFTYHTADQEWDPTTMTWKNKDGEKTGWNSKTVTVSNRSGDKINVTFGYTPKEDAPENFYGYIVSVSAGLTASECYVRENLTQKFEVAAATAGTDGNNGTATVAEFTITPDGAYTVDGEEPVTVGTITLTLS